MPNKFKNDQQRLHWNEYNRNYSRNNYRTITIKLSTDKYADVISYLESDEKGFSHAIKTLLEEKVRGK